MSPIASTHRNCNHNRTIRRRSFAQTAKRFAIAAATSTAVAIAGVASATWSVVIVDTDTKEIAIGSATCLTFFDLQKGASIVVPEMGAAAAQSYVDNSGQNRLTIWLGLLRDTPPDEILQQLEDQDSGHQTRQYGIVDTRGRMLTFTGTQCGAWAGGLVGQTGSIHYAIQGNVITGEPVITAAEEAILNTPGSLAEKLMAAMEAARDYGGDGRCSCAPNDPEGCGSPPPNFDKSAHIGYMLVARAGDELGDCNTSEGCASGDYYMNFNYAFMSSDDPDPVDLLRESFEQFKLDQAGRVDAIESSAGVDMRSIPADNQSSTTMTIELRDLNGDPVSVPVDQITVAHKADTPAITRIGAITDLGGGVYELDIRARLVEGMAEYDITVDDGIRPVILMPRPVVHVNRPSTGFRMGDPVPGLVGESNEICAAGGTPDATAYFLMGRNLGAFNSPCGLIYIKAPSIIATANVEPDGSACISGFVPNSFAGKTIILTAVQTPGCTRANVVTYTFP